MLFAFISQVLFREFDKYYNDQHLNDYHFF